MKFIYIAVLVSTYFTYSSSLDMAIGSPCSQDDIEARCIPISSCPFAMALLKERYVNKNKDVLQSMFCGFQNTIVKVCCPKNETPIVFPSDVLESRPQQTAPPIPPSTIRSVLPSDGANTVVQVVVNVNEEPTTQTSQTNTIETTFIQRVNSSKHTTEDPKSTIPTFTTPYPAVQSPSRHKGKHASKTESSTEADIIQTVPREDDGPKLTSGVSRGNFSNNSTSISNGDRKRNILPDRTVCGFVGTEERIYGGDLAEIDEFPWIARINIRIRDETAFACAGVLISERYVLTAAHCTVAPASRIIGVRLGEWDTETDIDCSNGLCNDGHIDVGVEEIITHKDYKISDLSLGDIALLRLSHPVNFTDYVEPICLPTSEYVAKQDIVPGTTYLTAGWGLTELGETSVIKRKLELNTVDISICAREYKYTQPPSSLNSICAGGRKNRDTCQGDSGGPLVKKITENYHTNWFLFGITSFGSANCGAEGRPGLYTRVTKYMDWILENIR